MRDALLAKQMVASLRQVLAPKASGTRNLSEACVAAPLDGFALFSSIAALLGNAGQANYAAANAVLDAAAAQQQSQVCIALLYCSVSSQHGCGRWSISMRSVSTPSMPGKHES